MSTDWNNLFKPEMFTEFAPNLYPDDGCAEYIAEKANDILKKALAEALVVYGQEYKYPEDGIGWRFENACEPDDEHTHRARLVNIERVEKPK